MGFNPHRKHRAGPADLLLIAAVFAAAGAMVVWAFLG